MTMIILYVFGFSLYSISIGTIGLILGRIYGKHCYDKFEETILKRMKENGREKNNKKMAYFDNQNNDNINENDVFIATKENSIILEYNDGYYAKVYL